MARSNKILVGMKEIVEFTGISEQVLRQMAEAHGLPARKIDGTWYSNTDAIEDWMYSGCYPKGKKRAVNSR